MKAVVWGLKSKRHTHRYIHAGFYAALRKLGLEAVWVDDSPSSSGAVSRDDLVIALGDCTESLPLDIDARFVIHNFDLAAEAVPRRLLNLQVLKRGVVGERLGEAAAYFDSATNTLFQPWGLPPAALGLFDFPSKASSKEFWIGSIWNNDRKQGNQETIASFRLALKSRGIEFKHLGSEGPFQLIAEAGNRLGVFPPSSFSLSEEKARKLSHRSAVGATIVGNWQKENGYVPCRLFKNLAAGHPIYSNSDFSHIFPGLTKSFNDMEQLIDARLSLNESAGSALVQASQQLLSLYTYEEGLNRILRLV